MTDDASARGRRSRRKGHDFERHVAAMMRDLGVDARRTIQSRGGGKDGSDVTVDGYHIEAKTGACPNLWAAMAQATADAAGSGRVPVVVAHREAPAFEVIVLPLDVGLGMLAACIRAAKGDG